MRKLAIGQRDKKGHHRAQVHRQQQGHSDSVAPDQQGQACQADEEEQGDEAAVHGFLRGVTVAGVAAQVEPQQTGRPDQQANAAHRAQDHGQAGVSVRRLPVEQVVVEGGHRGGGKAQHEAVKGQVVKAPAPQRGRVVTIGAAFSRLVGAGLVGAVQVLQAQRGRSGFDCGLTQCFRGLGG